MNTKVMDSPLHVAMASVWNYAPPPVMVDMYEGVEECEEIEAPRCVAG